MNPYVELAMLLQERENPSEYTPMTGRIIELPKLKIQLGSNIILDSDDIKSTFDIYEKSYDDDGNETGYININKKVVLLPSKNKFIAIGVLYENV